METHKTESQLALALFFLATALPVEAYVGPGSALGVIGSILATLAVLLLAIFGLVLYPLKLLREKFGRGRKRKDERSNEAPDDPEPARDTE